MKKIEITGIFLAAFAFVANADVSLGKWHVIGPFKDEEFGNISRTIEFPFAPEKDALAESVSLDKTYQMLPFPGYLDLNRKWRVASEYLDGFYNLLPRGPAPSRNEATYLYRTIESDEAETLTAWLRMQDMYKVWVNGKLVENLSWISNLSRYNKPKSFKLPLQKGANHLLIKNVSRWAEHGFAFGIEGEHEIVDSHYVDVNTYSLETVAEAEKYIRAFKFSATPIPMNSPAEYKMDKALASMKATPGAAEYDQKLNSLEKDTVAFLKRVDEKSANDFEILEYAKRLENFLKTESKNLPPILFIRKPLHATNAIAPYHARVEGTSAICLFDPANPESEPKVIFEEEGTKIHNMSLSFDAKTIYFAARRKGSMWNWHIYKINVDGTNLTQLTKGNHDNISACELPNGRIAYISTQKRAFVVCQVVSAGSLYTMAADGSDIRLLSANIDSDHTPRVTNDGKILFSRWDYGVEKNVFARHALWTVNPDGTNLQLHFGNTIEDPAAFWDAQPIPGRQEILCTFGPHHNFQAGMIGLIWNGFGPEAPRGSGYRWVTREKPIYGDLTYGDAYQNPFPFNEKQFVASYGGESARPKWERPKNFQPWSKLPIEALAQLNIVYVDAYGNELLLHDPGDAVSAYHTQLLMPRVTPPVVADKIPPVPWNFEDPETMARTDANADQAATMMVQDVYQGISEHVQRGEAKFIAVMEQVTKTRRMAGGEAWGHTPIIGRGTVHARRLIGLVPVEEDGSAFFKIPALRSVSLNVLDKNGKTLMRMGSDIHVMPNENLSCIGCHEIREHGHGVTPPMTKQPLAVQKAPMIPQKQGWGTNGLLDYVSVVQPVWDKHCISCHSGANPKGNVNMTDDKTRFFNQSYDHLIDRDIVDHLSVFSLDHDEGTPKTVGAIVSQIDKYMSKDHCKSEISWEERFRVYCWIDANVPYYGTNDYITYPEFAKNADKVRGIGARDAWESQSKFTNWAQGDLQEISDRRCSSCHERKVLNQSWFPPLVMNVRSDVWGDKALTSHGFGTGKWKLVNKLGPEFRINLTNPAYSLFLQAPLSKEAGGAGLCQRENGEAVFKDKNDPDYQKALKAIQLGSDRLKQFPRIDMIGIKGFVETAEEK